MKGQDGKRLTITIDEAARRLGICRNSRIRSREAWRTRKHSSWWPRACAGCCGIGARRGEIAALKWCDLDLDAGAITIRHSAVNVGREVVYKAPKSKKSQRSDVLPPFVVDLLKAHRRQQKKRRGDLGFGRPHDDGFVFTRADGTSWDPSELLRQFSRLIRRRKLRAVRFHDLRHAPCFARVCGRCAAKDDLQIARAFEHRHHVEHLRAPTPRGSPGEDRPPRRVHAPGSRHALNS